MTEWYRNFPHIRDRVVTGTKDRFIIPFLILFIADLAVIALSFLLAYGLRFYTGLFELYPPPPPPYIPDIGDYMNLAAGIAVVGVFVFERFGLYHRRVGLDRNVHSAMLVIAILVTYIFVMALLFNYRQVSYSRLTVALAIPITCVGVVLARHVLKLTQFFMIRNGIGFQKTILVGPDWRCSEYLLKLHEHHGSQFQVMGYITPEKERQNDHPYLPCLGTVEDLPDLLSRKGIDQVIIAMPPSDHKAILALMDECRAHETPHRIVPELYDHLSQNVSVEEVEMLPSIIFGETPLYGAGQIVKRAMDIIVASVALIVGAPLMIIVSILVRFDSKGSVLYVQERIGNDGRKFRIYKFRSMVDNAEKDCGPVWATANDPRTTRIGRFLRRYNLDELPQFLNVLRGDMSIVGPRPERPYFVDRFKDEIPLYMRRHIVKTGITGWAQVHGLRGDTSVIERTEYDLYYVHNWSVLLDIKIMWKTLTSFKNAY